MRADFLGHCTLCGDPIHRGTDVMFRNGGWIHTACHPGGSDEE
jgi:hypothetical protein